MSGKKQKSGVDPVVTEIIRNGFIAATEEMKTNLMRTAYNMIIYEALDFTVGLFDRHGNTVSIGIGFPRSEERRVGEKGRSRWWPYHLKKKIKKAQLRFSLYCRDSDLQPIPPLFRYI